MNRLLVGILVGIVTAGAGCVYPVDVKPECRERVNGCLSRCQGGGAPNELNPESPTHSMPVDNRSMCEKSCHDLCF